MAATKRLSSRQIRRLSVEASDTWSDAGASGFRTNSPSIFRTRTRFIFLGSNKSFCQADYSGIKPLRRCHVLLPDSRAPFDRTTTGDTMVCGDLRMSDPLQSQLSAASVPVLWNQAPSSNQVTQTTGGQSETNFVCPGPQRAYDHESSRNERLHHQRISCHCTKRLSVVDDVDSGRNPVI